MKRYVQIALVMALILTAFAGAHAESQFFDSNGTKIHYIVQGEGEPVVLIHGFTANAMLNWGAPGVIAALAADYKVIALDCRGHGRSGKPHGVEHYGTEMVNDVVRLLDHLKIEKAHIVGYSMGGLITMSLIANHPDRIISASPGGAGWIPADSPESDISSKIADSLESGKGFRPLFDALTPAGQPKMSDEEIEALNAMMIGMNDIKALASVARGFTALSVTEEQLKANKVPTLALIGEIDPMKVGVDAMEQVMSRLKVVVIDGADHMTAFSNATYISSLKAFLAEHTATSNAHTKSDEGSDHKKKSLASAK